MSLQPIFMPEDQSRPQITVHPRESAESRSEFQPRKAFQKATLGDDANAWGGNGFGADDFIDLINPLQHIPLVGQVYRMITGDTISAEASILGGTLFGGPMGMAAASISALMEHESSAVAATQQAAAPQATKPEVHVAQQQTQPHAFEMAQMLRQPVLTPTFSPPPAVSANEWALGDEPQPIAQAYQSMNAPVSAEPADAFSRSPLPEELQKHDVILELFGSGVSSLQGEYRKTQQLSYAQQAQKQLTV